MYIKKVSLGRPSTTANNTEGRTYRGSEQIRGPEIQNHCNVRVHQTDDTINVRQEMGKKSPRSLCYSVICQACLKQDISFDSRPSLHPLQPLNSFVIPYSSKPCPPPIAAEINNQLVHDAVLPHLQERGYTVRRKV